MSNRTKFANSLLTAAAPPVPLSEILRAKWKREIKKLPPGRRWSWLKSQEAITALGAKQATQFRKQLESRGKAIDAGACTSAWADHWTATGNLPPGLQFVSDGHRILQADDSRKHSVRLQLSRGVTRIGISDGAPTDLPTAGKGSPRWTPPQVVEVEDELDLMDMKTAEMFHYPASPSAVAIFYVRLYGGHQVGGFSPRDRFLTVSQGGGDPRLHAHVSDGRRSD